MNTENHISPAPDEMPHHEAHEADSRQEETSAAVQPDEQPDALTLCLVRGFARVCRVERHLPLSIGLIMPN